MLNNFPKPLVLVGLSALCLSIVFGPAKAATINWGSAQNIVGAADVLTTGSLFASANFGGSPSVVTVNGVQFDPFTITNGGTSQTVGNITLTGTSNQAGQENLRGSSATLGGPASYNGLLSQTAFLSNTTTPPTLGVIISGLTIGADYLIQYWVNDGRTSPTNFSNRTTIVGGVTLDVNVSGASGGFGQYITGTFTADATTQSFNAIAGSAGRADANAMQVRVVPEPSTIAIVIGAVGSVAGWRLRRSKKGLPSSSST